MDEGWLLWPLLSVVTGASFFVYLSFVLKKTKSVEPLTALVASHSAAFVPLLVVSLALGGRSHYPLPVGLVVLTSALLLLSRQLYYYAYANTDVANITVFSALTPVYTLLTGFFLAGEWPPLGKLLALIFVSMSVFALFLPTRPRSVLEGVIAPFASIRSSPPILCAFLSTIPTAFAAVAQKRLLHIAGPLDTSVLVLGTIAVFGACLLLTRKHPLAIGEQLLVLPWHFWLFSAALFSLNHVIFCRVMQTQLTAIALVIQRCSIVLQMILAYFLLNERSNLQRRMLVGVSIIGGFMVLVWPS